MPRYWWFDSTFRLSVVRLCASVSFVDDEGDDPLGMEPDERAAFGAECLCHAADLQTSHAPWPDRDEVIDDECSATVVSDVPELPASCQVVSVDGNR
jgi:hypothetical protein